MADTIFIDTSWMMNADLGVTQYASTVSEANQVL